MCGIVGFIDFTGRTGKDLLVKMTDVLTHRGPDKGGYELFQFNGGTIGFGHRRLSIIDLSNAGDQPMQSYSGKYWITLNGEIYNYREIKEELLSKGYRFHSNSDTEVALHAYEAWGVDAVQKFIGMFAFVVYDMVKSKVLLFRDRAGVKPLHYYQKGRIFLFSSEIKSFHQHSEFIKEIDNNALGLFFRYGYIPSPFTIFKNTSKLLPGHYLELDLRSETVEMKKYWDVLDYYNLPKLKNDYQEVKERLKDLFISAFNYRMVSDVPVGVFLSSGYDSSTVAAILNSTAEKPINTYTIGFENSMNDEAPAAERLARHIGTNHTTLYCDNRNIENIVKKIPFHYDEPFGDSSAIPTTLVSELAQKEVKVVLSADGGDETFAGYAKHYQNLNAYKLYSQFPLMNRLFFSLLKNHKRFSHKRELFEATTSDDVMRAKIERLVYNKVESRKILLQDTEELKTFFDDFKLLNNGNDFLNKVLAIDYKTYLENDILAKVDRATMTVSIEGREPLLDHRIIEFVAQLPSDVKFRNNVSKFILKDINKDYIPEGLMHNKKLGFSGPVDNWIRSCLKDSFVGLLDINHFPSAYLDYKQTSQLVNAFLDDNRGDWYQIYQLFAFLSWYKFWM
jgi:asparagine synthase (glutamine-hydrolysing)